ncbi:hypothetical protein GCM10008014_39210 [Paenibacillus silvae]|uniref:Secreted protein n=1 Tax=Paenibacillus silvae TaxID=1325358 RepID=A0ABQ1ZHB2_9BACL|nr:hypothetical protein GCM10008014_39210 [Paenibacillus silvae]
MLIPGILMIIEIIITMITIRILHRGLITIPAVIMEAATAAGTAVAEEIVAEVAGIDVTAAMQPKKEPYPVL